MLLKLWGSCFPTSAASAWGLLPFEVKLIKNPRSQHQHSALSKEFLERRSLCWLSVLFLWVLLLLARWEPRKNINASLSNAVDSLMSSRSRTKMAIKEKRKVSLKKAIKNLIGELWDTEEGKTFSTSSWVKLQKRCTNSCVTLRTIFISFHEEKIVELCTNSRNTKQAKSTC